MRQDVLRAKGTSLLRMNFAKQVNLEVLINMFPHLHFLFEEKKKKLAVQV